MTKNWKKKREERNWIDTIDKDAFSGGVLVAPGSVLWFPLQTRQVAIDIPASKEANVINMILKKEYYASISASTGARTMWIYDAHPTGKRPGEYYLMGIDYGSTH